MSFGERAPLNLKLQLVDCCCSLIGLNDYSKVLFVDDNPELHYKGNCSLFTGEISQFLLNGASRFFAFGIDCSLNTSSSPISSSLPFSNKLNWLYLTVRFSTRSVTLPEPSVSLTSSSYYRSWCVSTRLVYCTLLLQISRTVNTTLPTLKHSPPKSSKRLVTPATFRCLILSHKWS